MGFVTYMFNWTVIKITRFAFYSQQIENISSVNKDDQKVRVRGYKCCTNAVLESSSEETLYRKYVICLKKYQLAIK